jgi:hypothetical protein
LLQDRDALTAPELADEVGVALHWIRGDEYLLVSVTRANVRALRFAVGPSRSFEQLGSIRLAGARGLHARPDVPSVARVASWTGATERGAALFRWQGQRVRPIGFSWEELSEPDGFGEMFQ